MFYCILCHFLAITWKFIEFWASKPRHLRQISHFPHPCCAIAEVLDSIQLSFKVDSAQNLPKGPHYKHKIWTVTKKEIKSVNFNFCLKMVKFFRYVVILIEIISLICISFLYQRTENNVKIPFINKEIPRCLHNDGIFINVKYTLKVFRCTCNQCYLLR